jgi:SAM-dependent methyltransferase
LGKHPANTLFSYNWAYVRSNRTWFRRHRHRLRGRLLDLGCGHCPYFPLIKDSVESYHGYDFALTGRTGLPRDPKLVLANLNSDGSAPVDSGFFDSALSNQVFYSVYDTEAYLRELSRLLKPGGGLLLTDAFFQPLMTDPYDYQRTTPNRFWRDLERHGFRVESYEASGYFFSGTAMALAMLLVMRRPFGKDSVAALSLSRQLLFAPLICCLNLAGLALDTVLPLPRFPANMLFLASKTETIPPGPPES